MLKLEGIQELRELAEFALGVTPDAPGWDAKPPEDYHVTLQFVGRDLAASDAARVVAAAFAFADAATPIAVQLTGKLDAFSTTKGRYLVALADPAQLSGARAALLGRLQAAGISPRDTFAFRPHLTLLEGPPGLSLIAPPPFAPFAAMCNELTVKYGDREMGVEL